MSRKRAVVGLACCCVVAGCDTGNNSVVIKNGSDQVVRSVEVKIGRSVHSLSQVDPGDTRTIVFRTTHAEAAYDCTVWFEGGSQLRDSLGYVTPGLDTGDTIVIGEHELRLRNKAGEVPKRWQ